MHIRIPITIILIITTLIPNAESRCKIIPLQNRKTLKANRIFSGTVLSLFMTKRMVRKPIRAARVVVKRIFRGQDFSVGDQVVIKGLWNPKICFSQPEIGDTMIFFVNSNSMLKSSLLKTNPRNLRHLKDLEGVKRTEGKKLIKI